MYLKWFDKKKFIYEIISEHKGEEAGIKSSTLKVQGHTSFALRFDEGEDIDIVHKFKNIAFR